MNRRSDDFREYEPEVVIANVERDYGSSTAEVCRRFIFAPAEMPCRPAVPDVIERSDPEMVSTRRAPRYSPGRR